MSLDEHLKKDSSFLTQGGVLGIEQEIGAGDGISYAKEVLESLGYKTYHASGDKGPVSVFAKAMPDYSKEFRIEKPPRIMVSYFVNDTGMLISQFKREETGLDDDIFTNMLHAVGSFVADSFSMISGDDKSSNEGDDKSSNEGLGFFSFKDKMIHISDVGEYGAVAVLYEGNVSGEIKHNIDEINKIIHHTKELESFFHIFRILQVND